jgi:hypothetical protein
MRSTIVRLIIAGLMLGIAPGADAEDVGQQPIPVFTGVQVRAEVAFDPSFGHFIYHYTVTNPASNTGQIRRLDIDVSQPFRERIFSGEGLTIAFGIATLPFDEVLALRLDPAPMVPVGLRVPPGWRGGLSASATAFFGSGDPLTIGSDFVTPGETQAGFELLSQGLPTIRQIEAQADWLLVVAGEDDATPALKQRAREVRDALRLALKTVGPSFVSAGSYGHWDQLRDDLAQAIQLGWIPDAALAAMLTDQLTSARQALDAGDGTLAKSRLDQFLQTIGQSTPAQRTSDAFGLLTFSAEQLKAGTLDTPFPFEPKVTPSPSTATLGIGTTHTITATVLNLGDPAHPPITDFDLGFLVTDGPNQGLFFNGLTDANGQLSLVYTSQQVGTDRIMIGLIGEAITEMANAEVVWSGGPDLVVPHFVPPLLESEPGRPFTLTESTANSGSLPAPPSTTRYYLTTEPVVDPATARVLGERAVPALGPGERSDGASATLTVPADLPAGRYHLAACADAPGTITELEEQNNCSFSLIDSTSRVVPLHFEGVTNSPPVCTAAVPSTARLWPPNHKLADIAIQGVTDPDNDPLTIRITSITQDEPTNGLGDGDVSPDGFGVGGPQAQVRKERSGTGNGRVYVIGFAATDGKGGACAGSVGVGVPHDQSQGAPVNDGQLFDSTLP